MLRSRPLVVTVLLAVAGMLAFGFLPLFAGPGYESALAGGVLLPSLAAVAAALELLGSEPEPFDALARGVATGAVLAAAGYATTLVHGLRAGFCDPVGGTIAFALGPGVGALLGGAWGTVAGAFAKRGRSRRARVAWSVGLALLGPLAGIAVSVARFFTSPMIFAFDPFFGFFSGALYDTVVDATPTLLTYRLGSALTLLAALVLSAHLARTDDGRLRFVWRARPGIALVGAACAFASAALVVEGHRLGHWETAQTIAEALGGTTAGARCDVVYSRQIRPEDARLFAKDCDEEVRAGERYFGVSDGGRFTAYLFRDSAEKRFLMGAADTYIAKPWRREVYLQASGYPHPVLGHEIAHAVTGEFATPPLRVPGSLGGVLANPGLIEGAAVAATPDEGELTPAEWSRAMLDLKLLPPIRRVFALGFLGENASKSYTVAGAFVGWVHDRFGAEALRRWYQGEPLEKVAGEGWDALEADWHAELARLAIPEAAMAIAKARFDRPSVFGRRCPHMVDLHRKEADRAQGRGDFVEATRDYERLLALDPHDDGARLSLVTCALRRGEEPAARRALEDLARDEKVPRTIRDRALGELADLDLEDGDVEKAKARYDDLAARTLDEDVRRTIEVKVDALADPRSRAAIAALLVGTNERGIDAVTAATLLGAWQAEAPDDGLPEYLLAKGLVARGLWEPAKERLDRALGKRLPRGRVTREALRVRVIVACALGDAAGARAFYASWRAEGEPSGGRKDAMRRLVERCAGP